MTRKPSNTKFFSQIVDVLQSARSKVVQTVNQTMVLTYFEIGRMIVEEEQDGKERADYGKQILKELSDVLTKEFGKGFSVDNLENMRRFYVVYGKSETLSRISENTISETSSRKFDLSWSHYLKLMRIDDENERKFYEIESFKNNWSVRELERQFDSALYTRLVLSRDKDKVKELSEKGLVLEKQKMRLKTLTFLNLSGFQNIRLIRKTTSNKS